MSKINVIITTCNWFNNIWNIVNWLDDHKDKFEKIIIVDNSTSDESIEILEDLCKVSFLTVIKNKSIRDLRKSLEIAYDSLDNDYPILTIESDAKPNHHVLFKLLYYFEHFSDSMKIASIGPFYNNGVNDCYPVFKHWYTDDIILEREDVIRNCKGAGNPFLFSLWSNKAFSEIKNVKKNFIGVDSEISKITFEKGYTHLRLSNMSITHINGGKNSHE